jgi:hypothetical protein
MLDDWEDDRRKAIDIVRANKSLREVDDNDADELI